MELKNLFKVSAIVAAMALTGCGGDIEVTPTVNDNSVNNSNNTTNNEGNGNTGGDTGTTNPCTARTVGSTEVQGQFQAPHCVQHRVCF